MTTVTDPRLASYRDLVKDWDGYGARPITEAALEAAQRLLDAVGTTWLCPTPLGGVEMDWDDLPSGHDLCVDVDDTGTYGYLLMAWLDPERDPNHEPVPNANGYGCQGCHVCGGKSWHPTERHHVPFEQIARLVRLHHHPGVPLACP